MNGKILLVDLLTGSRGLPYQLKKTGFHSLLDVYNNAINIKTF